MRSVKTNAKFISFEIPKGFGTPFAEKGVPLKKGGQVHCQG
jgi:hypothetical protein